MKIIKVGSDFSGVGAFNQALIRIGMPHEHIFACDWDKYARITYIHNYGEPKYFPKDVYEREIPKESLDIYMTSPPCQAFSIAGKRLGKADSKGILFFNSHEFIQVNKPRFFIFENVKGLLSDDNGNTFQEWVNMLGGKSVNGLPILFPYDNSVPYHLYWQVLNSKKHGIPQNRERVFLVGIRDDEDNSFQFPKEEHLKNRLRDVLEYDVNDKYFLSEKMVNYISKDRKGEENLIVNREIATTITCEIKKMQRSTQDNYISRYYLSEKRISTIKKSKRFVGFTDLDLKESANCVVAGYYKQPTDGEYLKLKSNIRRLTPRECFRLQDFPDTFKFVVSDSQLYKQAGNSITVRVLEKILRNLKL